MNRTDCHRKEGFLHRWGKAKGHLGRRGAGVDMNREINLAFMKMQKRAESIEREKLVETFVDVGPLFTLLATRDHQVLYGRRGTGKTHAFMYLAESVREGGVPIYIDMRLVGSTGGIYSDSNVPISERATRLLMDTLGAVHDGLLEFVLQHSDINLAAAGPRLDEFAEAITEIQVVGPIETEVSYGAEANYTNTVSSVFRAGIRNAEGSTEAGYTQHRSDKATHATRRMGTPVHRVNFGRVGTALRKLVETLAGHHVWLLLDEWSAVPVDLQPYLADLLRRSVFPVQGVTVKIAAIEQRTSFSIRRPDSDYIGIELGADAAANLSLDDFMVFDNDPVRATEFFQELIFKHFTTLSQPDTSICSPDRLVAAAFTQRSTFEELVRAAEGVPRDAINILSLAAQKAGTNRISIDHVRVAARTWYQRDKESAVATNPDAQELLHWIIDEVIAHRRARAFLLRADVQDALIDALFDARVLHLLKRSISTHDQPGVRYNAYKIDYGCYVDLLTTAKAPQGLLPGEDDTYIEVPPDDYRAIRRAVLDLDEFKKQLTAE